MEFRLLLGVYTQDVFVSNPVTFVRANSANEYLMNCVGRDPSEHYKSFLKAGKWMESFGSVMHGSIYDSTCLKICDATAIYPQRISGSIRFWSFIYFFRLLRER